MKNKRLKELISVYIAKNPGRTILLTILIFNVVFLMIAACVISYLAPSTLENHGFWASIFYTLTMILDAGCIQFIIADIGTAGVTLIIICVIIVLIGMIAFTGSVIGYITNYISNFIDHANSGTRKLDISNHTVILNWNTRASEIINDLLYTGDKEEIVVLVNENGDAVEREIKDRIADTIVNEENSLKSQCQNMSGLKRWNYLLKNRLKNNLTVIVRQGDTFSTKQLRDISLSKAKTVIILGNDISNSMCKYDYKERLSRLEKGNSNTIKTLVQVAEITSANDSADNQKIVVEVDDDWTLNLVNKIIEHKERLGKCNIVPVMVNKILGQILAQFSIMPELNLVYSELFSNKGAEFFCKKEDIDDENKMIDNYLSSHFNAIPITNMETKTGKYTFYVANQENAIKKTSEPLNLNKNVKLHRDYWLERRNIIILGHNTKSSAIMEAFNSFRDEWNYKDGKEILNIIVVDDKKNLEKNNYYRDYSYVNHVIEADVYDRQIIMDTINNFIDENEGYDVSILILSDDAAMPEDLDSNALTYLIYVQDIVFNRLKQDSEFDRQSVDVVVEILNPKNYDVVHNYSVDNVVISNRYISKMVTQIGEKEALFELYNDILTYDTEGCDEYESKELYVKKVSRFFEEVPPKCTAAELIRMVYNQSPENNKSIVLGYVDKKGSIKLFTDDQTSIQLDLTDKDKLIMFSNH